MIYLFSKTTGLLMIQSLAEASGRINQSAAKSETYVSFGKADQTSHTVDCSQLWQTSIQISASITHGYLC